MKIFKFGGASIKDAKSVKNIYDILQKTGYDNTLLVISAMGKTTNALEIVLKNYFDNPTKLQESIQEVKKYHLQIAIELFDENNHPILNTINTHFNQMEFFLNHNKSPNYSFVYDQVVSYGEIIATAIISHYFNYKGLKNSCIDVRNFIKTDTSYRDAAVDWNQTLELISKGIKRKQLNITQGFLGSDPNNFTTTLGREGSDYTAAIFAYCLNAESVTIWKDVPGVLSADPRYFENAVLLEQISYREAIELAFYGATVIHPKTLQPLQKKEIPLYVRSFINPELSGTKVSKNVKIIPQTACFIVKKEQCLISLSSIDFSFIMEEHISEIFKLLHQYKMKVSLIQNSAISFSVCVEDKFHNFLKLKSALSKKFLINWNENVSLYTIRYYTKESVDMIGKDKTILIKQILGDTIQVVTKD
ncbi:MAG: aspartate kinase [Flavobacteriaceae bacterium]|nr:aspartate kinase [Flavobacteriaceae bacterium]